MFTKKIKLVGLIFVFSILSIGLTGCVSVKGGAKDTSGIDGGVFKSLDKATTWKQKVSVPTISGSPASFANVNVASFAMDPSDSQALYFGSIGSGLLYTYDGGETWRLASGLEKMTIRSIAVSPDNKCEVYVSINNKVLKSIDCSRTWEQIYYDNETNMAVEYVAVDHYDTNNVYIAISRGDIIKSSDRGKSWRTVYRVEKDRIRKIAIDPNDSRKLYVLSYTDGIFRSSDNGETWEEMTDLKDYLKEQDLGMDIKDLVFVDKEPGVIYISTYYGLIKSTDNAESWEKISLIPPEEKVTINALAVNPENSKEIYYVTNTTFYRSLDGGENWTPSKLQTSRAGWKLLIDPNNTKTVYVALRKLEE